MTSIKTASNINQDDPQEGPESTSSQNLKIDVHPLNVPAGSRIAGTGHCVPALERSNASIESRLGLPSGWIFRRTGFSARRIAGSGQAVSDLAISAAKMALEDAKIDRKQVGTLLLATSTPDYLLPSTAPFVANQLNLSCGAIDLTGACSGFLYGLIMGHSLAMSTGKSVLLVAANVLSPRVNWKDRNTAGIFGDGAGAVVICPTPDPAVPFGQESERPNDKGPNFASTTESSHRSQCGFLGGYWDSDGEHWDEIMIPSGGSRAPILNDFHSTESASVVLDSESLTMQMKNGPAVFRNAVRMMKHCCQTVMSQKQISLDSIQFFLCHQASRRIVEETGRQLGLEPSQVIWKLGRLGNSSAATIPIALDIARKDQTIKHGDRILMATAGAGMAAAAVVVDF